MENKKNESILYREAPLAVQILIYLAIIIFLVFGLFLFTSMEDVVDGWFQTRTDVEVENGEEKGDFSKY